MLLSGGGTAGHVLPHTAVVEALRRELKQEPLELLYVGSAHGIERTLVERWGWPYATIPVGKLRRYWDWRHITDPFKIVAGFFKSLWIVRRFRPEVMFSKGGYVSVPVMLAAWCWRVPIVLHDSDTRPSLTTRWMGRLAKTVCLAHPEASKRLSQRMQQKIVVTGLPLRSEIFEGDKARARTLTGLRGTTPVLLVMGGSLGAESLNKVVEQALPKLLETHQVIHLSGPGKQNPDLRKNPPKGYVTFEYLEEALPDVYALADVVLTRGGANALAELEALGKSLIIVPLGTEASHGDQVENARRLESMNRAQVIPQDRCTTEVLMKALKNPPKPQEARRDESTLKVVEVLRRSIGPRA